MKTLVNFINENNKLNQLEMAVRKIGDSKAADIVHSMYDEQGYDEQLDKLDSCAANRVARVIYCFFPIAAIDAVIDAAK